MNSIQDLKNFDNLPDSAHVDVNVVAALFGCKPPTVWLRVRRNILPAPRRFCAHTRWNVGELRKILQGEPA
ncbi:MAG: transcriptional regulator [Pseudomonadota bacterium]|nr:transcriptional regulator [Pseudomonadota bacterium]